MKLRRRAIAAGILLALGCAGAFAHPLAPALLELRDAGEDRYDVTWRTSVSRVGGVDVEPELPAECQDLSAPAVAAEDGEAMVARWRVQCAGGLSGRTLTIRNLERSGINVILRVDSQGRVSTALLDARERSYTVPAPQAAPPVFWQYLALGIEHLVLGLDHLLFVAGLVLLVRGLKPLAVTVTAFTLGHSLTLGLATLGFAQVNVALMELGIALSVLALACELARPAGAPASALRRHPGRMAGGFGLLHGLGFASALGDVGLPQAEIPLALLAFNAGIELGQLAVVAALLIGAHALRAGLRAPAPSAALPRAAGVYALGGLAAYWCFERAASLLA